MDYATIWSQQRRREMKQTEFSRAMHPRNGIEGTHSELVRGHGLRRTKYRGFNRVGLSHYFMGAACNVKRYLKRLPSRSKWRRLTPRKLGRLNLCLLK